MRRKAFVGLAATAILAAGLVAGTATTAQAAPTNCKIGATYGLGLSGAAGKCTSGTGAYRVQMKCYDGTRNIWRSGNWATGGNWTRVNCEKWEVGISAHMQTMSA
ncbi:hypothetical protein [Kribbella sp. DT2]|uniref:hypothetical protein n=1 Tax=Kribbella sp. DT2 TaxID=3393427 RepID=UPI003CF03CF2